MTELALLARAFDAVPEPDETVIVAARAALVRLIASNDGSTRPRARESRPLLARLVPRTATRLRLVLVLLVLLLLVAGIATATYLSVHTWVSAGPRGIQHASDYKLTTVFTPADGSAKQANSLRFRFWSAFALGPRGHDLYALHRTGGARLPELVRIRGVDRGARLSATRVLALSELAGPRFRPAWRPRSDGDSLAIAPNGDLFMLAAGRDPMSPVRLARGDEAVFVLHPNGVRQRVLSLGELVRSNVLPNVSGETLLSLAATAPDRLWLRAGSFEGPRENLRYGSYRFLEVIDPNADGDWTDRVVRPIVLPRSVAVGGGSRWFWLDLVAEPPLPGGDRARSVLSTAESVDGGFRVYRIADLDDDGDALDRGEVQVVYDGRRGGVVAPVVLHDGGAARRELVVAGLTRFDRISLVSESGAVRDLARSFPAYFGALLAGANGDIYPVTEAGTVYRLEPAGRGARTGNSVPATIPAPELPPKGGVPQILFATPAPASVGIKDVQGPLYAVGADGRSLRKLPHGAAQCFSRDGRMIAFMSDARVPYEPHPYVANTDGSQVRELPAFPMCPFTTPVLSLWEPGRLVGYDVRTRHEVGPTVRFSGGTVSPDATQAVYVGKAGRGAGSPALRQPPIVFVDLNTRRKRVLGRPAPAGSRYATRVGETDRLEWSPDGTRIAYLTALRPRPGADAKQGRYVLWVRDVKSGAVVFSGATTGWMPRYTWSPNGAGLLLCIDDRPAVDSYASCSGGAPVPAGRSSPQPPARLLLVTISNRSTRLIAREPLVFADWAPSGGTLAYATPHALFLRTSDGRTRELATAPSSRWPGGEWLGWSPDGRYIGLSSVGPGAHWKLLPLATVDVHTGRIRVIRTPPRTGWATWWRR